MMDIAIPPPIIFIFVRLVTIKYNVLITEKTKRIYQKTVNI